MPVLTVRDVHTISAISEVGSNTEISKIFESIKAEQVDDYRVVQVTLAASEADTAFGPNQGIILESDSDFIVKVGGTGETAITTKSFKVVGALTILYLTNPSATDAVVITAVAYTPSPA